MEFGAVRRKLVALRTRLIAGILTVGLCGEIFLIASSFFWPSDQGLQLLIVIVPVFSVTSAYLTWKEIQPYKAFRATIQLINRRKRIKRRRSMFSRSRFLNKTQRK